ncbi:MAG: tetratricopeptide repeat protein, partial [Pseudomonadota bacterium]|nr:tetratricopeptide repeat protein [Pseudomonadota bacterium]
MIKNVLTTRVDGLWAPLALLLAGLGLMNLWLYAYDQPAWMKLIAFLGLVGVYPLTYVAYLGFIAKAQRQRLEDDFRLLGLEQEHKIKETVEKLYQTVYSPIQFVVYIVLIVLITLSLLWGYLHRDALGFIEAEAMRLVFIAYLGAYVFSVQELIRRYNTFDLQPQVYSSILVRMTLAILIVFVSVEVIQLGGGQIDKDNAGAWGAVLAFVIGVFPTQGIRWLTDQANRVLNPGATERKELQLKNLLGISSWHEARLVQMGIDDAQNLATVDIRKLLLTTQFDTQEIVSWIDQAILYTRVGDKIERFRDAKITSFHQYSLVHSRLLLNPPLAVPADQLEKRLEARERLALALGMVDSDELDRLGDASDSPNYVHIAEYYRRTAKVARQRAQVGMENIIGAIIETDYQRAVEEGERRLLDTPDDDQLWLNLGIAYYHLQRFEDAKQAYDKAIDLEPKLAEAYYSRSLIHIQSQNYGEALRDCNTAINLDRSHAKAFNNRGLAYLKLGYLDRAIEDFSEALRLDARLPEALLNRGVAYNAQGEFAPALKDFEHADLLSDAQPDLWLGWGNALLGVGDYLQAIAKLSQAV